MSCRRPSALVAALSLLAATPVAALLLLAATPVAAQVIRLPGESLDRQDLGYDFLDLVASQGSPGQPVTLKDFDTKSGYPPSGGPDLFARLRLRVGEPPGTGSVCLSVVDCYASSNIQSGWKIPPHAYAYAGANGPIYGSTGRFFAVSLFEPDRIRRSGGKTSSVRLKQSGYLLLIRGGWDSAFGVFSTSAWSVPDCKGVAQIKTTPKGQSTDFKVSCKEDAIDVVISGIGQQRLLNTLAFLGIGPELKFRWQGRGP